MVKLTFYSLHTSVLLGFFLSDMWFGSCQRFYWLGEDAGSTASPQTSCAHPAASRQPAQMSTNAQIVHTTASNQELATPKQGGFTPEWNIRPSYHPNLCPKRNVLSLVFFLRITPLSH